MTDAEFDILDELYFVTSFAELRKQLHLPDAELTAGLGQLAEKGYVKCLFPDPDSEIAFDLTAFRADYANYYFLATKEGLLHHNSR